MSGVVNAPIAVTLTPRPDILPLTPEREADLRRKVVWEAMSWVGDRMKERLPALIQSFKKQGGTDH